MTLWYDGILAALSAVGLSALLWMLAGLLFRKRESDPEAVTVLPLRGDAPGMEHRVRLLLARGRERIILLDCGLNAEERHRAQLLARRYAFVAAMTPQELAAYWKEREKEQ